MSITVIDKLSSEELAEYRSTAAGVEAVQSGLPSVMLTEKDVERVHLDHWEFVERIVSRYDLTDEEKEEVSISVFTGQIYLGGEG